jgi:hypothetical protein
MPALWQAVLIVSAPNNALLTDAFQSALRASFGAAKRER